MRGKPFIHVFTGDGAGKTTASLGVAMRALGHGQRVVMIQFMKRMRETGEYKAHKKFGAKFKIYQFGGSPRKKKAEEGLAFARKVIKLKPNLLILDEVNLAAARGLLKKADVVSFLRSIPSKINVILTGRKAPKAFLRIADGVSEIRKVKHRYDQGISAEAGIEF